jgi:hypothetical protein
MNKQITRLIQAMAKAETAMAGEAFVAPCVRGGRIRARVDGLVKTYRVEPRSFQGWGVFRPISDKKAKVEEEASFPLVASYLRLLPMLRLILVRRLRHASWLAYPANEADASKRFAIREPVRVHLVESAAPLDPILARFDGAAWWFEDHDRRADPTIAPALRQKLEESIDPAKVRVTALTPELRTAYGIAFRGSTKHRLGEKLGRAGGQLRDLTDHGDYWVIEWQTNDGQHHTSAVEKDLTVRSAGVCLSGMEREFDLSSLVGIMEGANAY